MKLGGASLFPIAIAALLAAITFWLEHAIRIGDGDHNGRNRHDPDFIVEQFRLRQFAEDGSLQHSASAPKMVHYADDDSTEITDPTFTFLGQPPMQMTARRGWMGKDGKEVRLEGNVRAVRSADDHAPEATVITQVLYVYPDDDLAHSDTPVTMTQGRSVIRGNGLDADGKQQTFVMKGPVHGTIFRQPSSRPR